MSPTQKKPNDAFAYLLSDQGPNASLVRIAAMSDFQVGLPENPSELQLTGRISYSTAFAEVQPSQIVYFPPDVTIFLVSIVPFEILRTGAAYSQLEVFKQTITVVLPQDPRVGQVCYVKDASGTAHVCAIKVQGFKIDGDDSKLLDYKDGCIGFVWSGAAWSTLSDGNQRSLDNNLLNKTIQTAIESYSPATTDPSYIVLTSTPSLPNERVLTAGSGITITDAGAGGSLTIAAAGGGSGDVVGPASATDNAIARFDLTTGKLIQNSGVTIDDSNNVTVAGRIIVTGGTTSLTDATLGNAAVGSFPYYDGGGNSAVYAMFGHKDLDHSSVVTNYALYQDNTGNTSINASTGKNLYFAINNVAMGAITNDIGSGVDAILFTGDLSTRTDITLGNTTGISETTIYAGTGDLNIGHNAAARTVNLGTGNNTTEQEVTVGSTSGRSPLVLRAGTGKMYLTGAISTDFIIGHTAGTGDITVGRSTASNTINIGNADTATTKTQTINIGAGTPTGTGKATVTVGNAGGASATNIYAGTGGITLSGSATTTITGSTSGQADAYIGTVEIGELSATKTSFPAVYAMFGHKALDHSADGNYALVQSNVGDTFLGAASTKAVVFKNGTSIVGYLDDNEISLTGKPSTAQDVTLGSTYDGSSLTINVGTGELKLASGSFAASRKISIGVGGDGTGNSETQTIYVGKYNPAGTINAYLRGDNVIIGDDGGAVTIGSSGTAVTFSGGASITHDLAINGGDLTTNVATFNLLNSTVTTLNVGGAATTLEIGAATGTTSINNALSVDGSTTLGDSYVDTVTINGTTTFAGSSVTTTFDGDIAVNGGDITTTAGTFNLANSATTLAIANSVTANQTVNIAAGATASTALKALNIGTGGGVGSTTNINLGSANGGTTTINSSLSVNGNTTLGDAVTDTTTIAGSLAVNGTSTNNKITSTQTSFNLLNTTVTTLNIGGAATSVNIGARSSGTTYVHNDLELSSNTIKASTGADAITLSGPNVTVVGDLTVSGGDIIAAAAPMNLVNAATIVNLGSTAVTRTTNIATGAANQTVTLGSTSGTSSLTLNAGSNYIATNTRLGINKSAPTSPLHVKCESQTLGLRLEEDVSTNYWGIKYGSSADLDFDYNATVVGYLQDGVGVANIDFTGQHRSLPVSGNTNDFIDKTGLIVVSSGQYKNLTSGSSGISINESLPTVELSTIRNQKSVFGVISDTEDPNETSREYAVGNWGSIYKKTSGDDRLIINSLGEGAIWVCNINGSLENGDYVTTCEITGYGMKQDDDLLHNYTVAKITCNCDFSLNNNLYQCEEFIHEGVTYRRAFVGCTYHCG